MNLSKSLYTRGLQCSKSLWLKKYKKDVLTPPDEQAKAAFETGDKVGALACQLFPDGKEIPFKGTTFDEKIALTQQYMDEGIKNIYEATFLYDNVQKTHQTGHPSRLHPASKNARHPATHGGDDPATFA